LFRRAVSIKSGSPTRLCSPPPIAPVYFPFWKTGFPPFFFGIHPSPPPRTFLPNRLPPPAEYRPNVILKNPALLSKGEFPIMSRTKNMGCVRRFWVCTGGSVQFPPSLFARAAGREKESALKPSEIRANLFRPCLLSPRTGSRRLQMRKYGGVFSVSANDLSYLRAGTGRTVSGVLFRYFGRKLPGDYLDHRGWRS